MIELELEDQINKHPLLYWYNIFDIDLNLLDQFNNNSIIELELRDQMSKHLLQ